MADLSADGTQPAGLLVCARCGRAAPVDGSPCPADGSTAFVVGKGLGESAVLEPTRKRVTADMPVPAPSHDTAGPRESAPGPVKKFESWGSERDDEVTRQSLDSLIGMKLGEYEVVERFASGGMGVLYRGIHPVIQKSVVIKLLKDEYASDPVQMGRLLEEARAVNTVHHRGIVDMFGFGQLNDGRGYVVMEQLDGQPLDEVLKERGRFSPAEAIEIMIELCGPMAAAHNVGVLHRDLKPANIFVVSEGDGTKHLKVLDFGLAKRTLATGTAQTSAGQVFGTPNYMAPEVVRQQPTGKSIDLYAMGCLFYELLVGHVPYQGENAFDVMSQHVNAEIPKASAENRDVPPELDAIITRLLAKNALDRFPSVEALRKALLELRAGQLSGGSYPGLPLLSRRPPGRWRRAAVVLALVAVTGVGGYLVFRPAPEVLAPSAPPDRTVRIVPPPPPTVGEEPPPAPTPATPETAVAPPTPPAEKEAAVKTSTRKTRPGGKSSATSVAGPTPGSAAARTSAPPPATAVAPAFRYPSLPQLDDKLRERENLATADADLQCLRSLRMGIKGKQDKISAGKIEDTDALRRAFLDEYAKCVGKFP